MEETKEQGSNLLYSVSLALLVVVLILDNLNIIFETVPVNIMYIMSLFLSAAVVLFSWKISTDGNAFIVGFISDLLAIGLLLILLTSPITVEKELLLKFYDGHGFSVFAGVLIFFEIATMDFLVGNKSELEHKAKMLRLEESIKETEEKLRIINEEIKAREESMRDE